MPRQARIDQQGMLHHVICRGAARCLIYRRPSDRDVFLGALDRIAGRAQARCLAWSLMPNHFHLLLVTGVEPLGRLMQRLLITYAVYFNHRYERAGHLFQNRYKAIVCEEEPYMLELVRYIHLNPLRGGLVKDMGELRRSSLSGHAALMGGAKLACQDTDAVLGRFHGDTGEARAAYESFVWEGVGGGRRPEFVGGGLPRSTGARGEFRIGRQDKHGIMGDERVLGGPEFVAKVLSATAQRESRTHTAARKLAPEEAIARAAEICGCSPADMRGNRRSKGLVVARSLACKWLVIDLGMTGKGACELLSMSPSAVTRAVERGREVERKNALSLGAA